jgi:hypothetical protein
MGCDTTARRDADVSKREDRGVGIRAIAVALVCFVGCHAAIDCTSAGCSSNVMIDATPYALAHPHVHQLHWCVERRCAVMQLRNRPAVRQTIQWPSHGEPVTVTADLGRRTARLEAATKKIQPNGAECGPTCYIAVVELTPDGVLLPG